VLGRGYGLNIERSWYSQGGFLAIAIRVDLMRSYEEYLKDIKEYIENVKETPTSRVSRSYSPMR
jgi:hypothetical protein